MQILKAIEQSSGQNGAKGRIAKEFGIANSTLSDITQGQDPICIFNAFETSTFEPKRKRLRMVKFEEVEDALLLWFKAIRSKNVPVIYFSLSFILLTRNTLNTKFVSIPWISC